MLKALLKKEFMALTAGITNDRRKGVRRSKGGIIGMSILFVVCYISIGTAFLGFSTAFSVLLPDRLWLYMAMSGLSSLVISVIGSVFMTYSMLYKAKDNDLLLALPIPPGKLLLSKMASIYIMAWLFAALPIIPALIIYWTGGYGATAASGIFSILSIFFIALLGTALSCILGWLVALVVGLFPKKNALTVIATLLFLGVYYVFYFRVNAILRTILANIDTVEGKISGYVYPIYKMGKGCAGDAGSFLIFAAICVVFFAIVYYVLSRTFFKIATRTEKTKTVEYKEKKTNQQSIPNALFRKEMKHYLGSPAYLLNCSMGTIFVVVAAVALLIKAADVREILEMFEYQLGGDLAGLPFKGLLMLVLAAVLCFLASSNDITAPSIALDAKTLWLSKSLPVDTMQIFGAKRKLHLVLTLVPCLIFLAAAAFVLKLDAMSILYLAVLTVLFTYFCANLGLMLGLCFPNLKWTNETMAVKQGMAVIIALFGSWVVILALGALYAFVLRNVMSPETYMRILIALFLVASIGLNAWLMGPGKKRFAEL